MRILSNSQLEDSKRLWPNYMARTLCLAQTVINTNPNPRVGCLLVKDNNVVAEGWHVYPGEDHAEVMALKNAKESGGTVVGATAFVSLEPCAHTGRTGPCAAALVESGITTVVIAATDPNPKVSGKGIAMLEEAGIDVFQLTDFETESIRINPGFHKRFGMSLPFVTLKMASSLDGRTALSNGKSKWITSSQARSDVQHLRAGSAAIITGVGTVLADDPSMNVRPDELNLDAAALAQNQLSLAVQPIRVVIDRHLQTLGTAKIYGPGHVIVYTTADEIAIDRFKETLPKSHQCTVIKSPEAGADGKGRVDLRFVLESLAQFECNDVFVEAGAGLCTAFLDAQLIDELIVYVAPKLLGVDAKPLLDVSGLKEMSEVLQFELSDVQRIGADVRLTLRPS